MKYLFVDLHIGRFPDRGALLKRSLIPCRILGLSILTVVIFGAAATSSASAAATTNAAQWYVTGLSTPLSGSKTLKMKVTKTFHLAFVGGGSSISLTAPEGECVECTILNKAATEKSGNVAIGTGKLRWKGVLVASPAGCEVVGNSITFNSLTFHADMMIGESAVWQFFPTAGKTFASFELGGSKCGVTGIYLIQGTWFGNVSNATGTFDKGQPLNFSPTINTNDGGALTVSGGVASVEGQGTFSLSPEETFTVK